MRWNGGSGEAWQLVKMGGADNGGSRAVEELPVKNLILYICITIMILC